MAQRKVTNVILIPRLLILYEEFERLFPDEGLYVSTPAMALLDLLVVTVFLSTFAFFLSFVGFTNHFRFAVIPYDVHAFLRVPYMSDFLGKVGIRLWKAEKSVRTTPMGGLKADPQCQLSASHS
jgi:hypothetical protein